MTLQSLCQNNDVLIPRLKQTYLDHGSQGQWYRLYQVRVPEIAKHRQRKVESPKEIFLYRIE